MAAKQLGSMAVGSIVKINEKGRPTEYVVVQQGSPSGEYYGFENVTLLLRKDIHSKRGYEAVNYYDSFDKTGLNSWMNDENTGFLSELDEAIRNAIPAVKFPYYDSSTGNVKVGAQGLQVKAILLSIREYGTSNGYVQYVGTEFEFFAGTLMDNTVRIANFNNMPESHWTRDKYDCDNWWDDSFAIIDETGGSTTSGENDTWRNKTFGVRPAIPLPQSLNILDDGTISVNQPPESPASITVPDSIQGGSSISISWAAANDPDGNLEGYILERSTDGGSGWEQVYQGPATSTTNTVAFGTVSVIYRVKAYDAAGAESGYRTSEQVTVTNNQAPAAPGSITVPELVKGGQALTVSWAAATDPDGNLTGYELERAVDGGSWAQVYKGSALSYTDQITKGWQSVQYRVRALDSYNAASSYTTSETRAVDNNTAPVIACEYPSGADLGEKTEDFTIPYSVSDVDGDPVTVIETADGTQLRQFTAEASAENALSLTGEAFMKLLNGPHSLKISASDGKAEVAHNLTFTKKVTSASVTLKEPLAVEGDITLAALRVSGSIPADALYTVEVTNNGNDDQPVWQDVTDEVKRGANIVFANHTAVNGAAFNFRVNVARGPSGEGGYIQAITGAFQ